jgi:hypothetical protein
VVNIGKESVIIRFPTRFSSKSYALKEIKTWHETAIKTAGGNYKEVEILFTDMKKLNLSMQEHTNYANLIKYMSKKASKKKK